MCSSCHVRAASLNHSKPVHLGPRDSVLRTIQCAGWLTAPSCVVTILGAVLAAPGGRARAALRRRVRRRGRPQVRFHSFLAVWVYSSCACFCNSAVLASNCVMCSLAEAVRRYALCSGISFAVLPAWFAVGLLVPLLACLLACLERCCRQVQCARFACVGALVVELVRRFVRLWTLSLGLWLVRFVSGRSRLAPSLCELERTFA